MSYRKIDLETYPRRAHFEHFCAMTDPWAGLTVPVDVTELVDALHRAKRPFYLSMLYAVARAANTVPELRRRRHEGGIIEYDHCPTSHTEILPDGTYAYCKLNDEGLSYAEYIEAGLKAQQYVREHPNIEEDADAKAYLFLSCVPWISFLHVKQPTTNDPENTNPCLVWGRYYRQEGRIYLPFDIVVHHGLCDGWHLTQFFRQLDAEIAAICRICQEEIKEAK